MKKSIRFRLMITGSIIFGCGFLFFIWVFFAVPMSGQVIGIRDVLVFWGFVAGVCLMFDAIFSRKKEERDENKLSEVSEEDTGSQKQATK